MRRRKNYPGDPRTPGTKDYSLILGNLIGYRNQLMKETDEQKLGALYLKVAEKLKELGFEKNALAVKKKAGRRKAGKFQDITAKKTESVINIATKKWADGKARNDEAKEAKKKEQIALKKKGQASA